MPGPARLVAGVALAGLALTACNMGPWATRATPKPLFSAFPASASSLPRAEADRPATGQGLVFKAFCVTFPDAPDRRMDESGELARVIEGGQRWLAQYTGGSRFRWDEAEGAPDITHFASRIPSQFADAFGILEELHRAGHLKPNHLPILFADLARPRSELLGEADDTGGVVFTYPHAKAQDARPNLELWANTWLHESFHSLGLVPRLAPHFSPFTEKGPVGHVKDDPLDLMGPHAKGLGSVRLDADRQDYYGHGQEDRPDLARSELLKPWGPKVKGRGLRPWVPAADPSASSLARPSAVKPMHWASLTSLHLGPGPEGSQSLSLFFEGLYDDHQIYLEREGQLSPAFFEVAPDGQASVVVSLWPEDGPQQLRLWLSLEGFGARQGGCLTPEAWVKGPLMAWRMVPGRRARGGFVMEAWPEGEGEGLSCPPNPDGPAAPAQLRP